MSITEIMVQEREERLFNLFTLIDEKSNYGERFNDCTLVEQNFWFLYNFHMEVERGGS